MCMLCLRTKFCKPKSNGSLDISIKNNDKYIFQTKYLPRGKGRQAPLTTLPSSVCRLSRENVGASTSDTPMGLHGLLQG
jgi:hypothetical protein